MKEGVQLKADNVTVAVKKDILPARRCARKEHRRDGHILLDEWKMRHLAPVKMMTVIMNRWHA